MGSYLRLEVVTPKKKMFASDVSEIQFPSAFRGYYGILPDHTPVLTPLGDGLVTCLSEGNNVVMAIFGGFAEVGPSHVTILARECEMAENLDATTISEQLNLAEKQIKDVTTPAEQQKLQAFIDACQIKLQALE